jgi:hypothetical protein
VGFQRRLQGGGLVVGRGEGVDAPDVTVLVFLEDRIGDALQRLVGVYLGGGGLGDGAGSTGDDL